MKLYYSPGACSLSPHIALREAELPFELVLVSLKSHQVASGTDYYAINPKGYVPLLELDDGQHLTEGPAIVQYIADLVPTKQLAPANGTMARYRMQEWLNFISAEIHKGYGPLYNAAMPAEAKALARARVGKRFAWVDSQLEGKEYLLGEHFSVADPYLFVTASWSKHVDIDITQMGHLNAYLARVAARPAVQAALAAENSGQ